MNLNNCMTGMATPAAPQVREPRIYSVFLRYPDDRNITVRVSEFQLIDFVWLMSQRCFIDITD